MSTDSDEDHDILVLDNGSGICKAGWSSNKTCRYVLSAVVGRPKYKAEICMKKDWKKDCAFVGDAAQTQRGILTLNYPMDHGIVTDWNDMEKIWHYLFNKEMHISPHEHSILITEPPLNPIDNRRKMTEIMFETFNVQALFIAIPAILSLYASGRLTGLVMDSGDGVSHTVPVYEGYALPHAIDRLDLAGRDITNTMMKMLNKRGYPLTSTADREITRNIKERLGYVVLDSKKEKETSPSSSIGVTYQLPDFQTITINEERYQCTEALFQPSLVGMKSYGLHEMIHHSIMNCCDGIQNILHQNIILSGGNTMFRGMTERMQKELCELAHSTTNVKVIAPPERQKSVWLGGAIYASLPEFRKRLLSKEDYEEYGHGIVSKKFF